MILPLVVLSLWFSAFAGPAILPPDTTSHLRKKTVAVLYFDNHTGDVRYDPFGKGLASMMMTDLSQVETVQVVEREHLESLIQEMELQQTDFFESETAVQVGRFVGAEYIITGSIAAARPELRLDSRVIRVETSEVVKAEKVTGKDTELFQLQGRLADALMDGLDIALSPEARARLEAEREANRIDDVETALAYSEALNHYDRGEYVEALERMNYVRTRAPSSRLVELTMETFKEAAAEKAKESTRKKLNKSLRKWLKDG